MPNFQDVKTQSEVGVGVQGRGQGLAAPAPSLVSGGQFSGLRGGAPMHPMAPSLGSVVAERPLPGSMRPFLCRGAMPKCFHPEQSQGLLIQKFLNSCIPAIVTPLAVSEAFSSISVVVPAGGFDHSHPIIARQLSDP